MDLNELINSLEQRRKGLAYNIWKQSYLTTLGISDLFKEKRKPASFPSTPEKASPELYPPKASIKMPESLKQLKSLGKGGIIVNE